MCKVIKPTENQLILRSAFGKFPTGVAVVTSQSRQDKTIGMTISSFNTVSLTPPLISWCIDRKARSYRDFSCCKFFNISVLSENQEAIAKRFATKGINKFDGIPTETGKVPEIPGSCANFLCQTERLVLLGDHLMLIGKVVDFRQEDGKPLIFSNGEFHKLNDSNDFTNNFVKQVA